MNVLHLPGGQKRLLASGEQSNGNQAKRARLDDELFGDEDIWQGLFWEDAEVGDMTNGRSTPELSLEQQLQAALDEEPIAALSQVPQQVTGKATSTLNAQVDSTPEAPPRVGRGRPRKITNEAPKEKCPVGRPRKDSEVGNLSSSNSSRPSSSSTSNTITGTRSLKPFQVPTYRPVGHDKPSTPRPRLMVKFSFLQQALQVDQARFCKAVRLQHLQITNDATVAADSLFEDKTNMPAVWQALDHYLETGGVCIPAGAERILDRVPLASPRFPVVFGCFVCLLCNLLGFPKPERRRVYESFVAAIAGRLVPGDPECVDPSLSQFLAELKVEYRLIAFGRKYDWNRDGNQARSLAEQVGNYRHQVLEPEYGVPAKWTQMSGSTPEQAIVVD